MDELIKRNVHGPTLGREWEIAAFFCRPRSTPQFFQPSFNPSLIFLFSSFFSPPPPFRNHQLNEIILSRAPFVSKIQRATRISQLCKVRSFVRSFSRLDVSTGFFPFRHLIFRSSTFYDSEKLCLSLSRREENFLPSFNKNFSNIASLLQLNLCFLKDAC